MFSIRQRKCRAEINSQAFAELGHESWHDARRVLAHWRGLGAGSLNGFACVAFFHRSTRFHSMAFEHVANTRRCQDELRLAGNWLDLLAQVTDVGFDEVIVA